MKDSKIDIDFILKKIHENRKSNAKGNEQKNKMRQFILLGEIAEEIFENVDEDFLAGCFIAAKTVYDEKGERYERTKERGREFFKNRGDAQI